MHIKKSIVLFIPVLILLSFLLSSSLQAQTSGVEGTLHIQINKINIHKGTLRIAVYREEDKFLSEDIFKGKTIKVDESDSKSINFELPFDTYAVSIIHDVNDNEALDTNLMGIPNEPFGFSRDAKPKFGPPDFEDAVFEFTSDNQQITINIQD